MNQNIENLTKLVNKYAFMFHEMGKAKFTMKSRERMFWEDLQLTYPNIYSRMTLERLFPITTVLGDKISYPNNEFWHNRGNWGVPNVSVFVINNQIIAHE